jgi:hypothetical protein
VRAFGQAEGRFDCGKDSSLSPKYKVLRPPYINKEGGNRSFAAICTKVLCAGLFCRSQFGNELLFSATAVAPWNQLRLATRSEFFKLLAMCNQNRIIPCANS